MNNETWKSILSVPNLEASSLGRIRVVPYTIAMPNGGYRSYGGTVSFGQWDGKRFIYRHKRNHQTYKVARLVCEAFNGPAPIGKPYCLHNDENSQNNIPTNLVWGTQKENMNYPNYLAYCKNRIGENNPYVKGKNGGRN